MPDAISLPRFGTNRMSLCYDAHHDCLIGKVGELSAITLLRVFGTGKLKHHIARLYIG